MFSKIHTVPQKMCAIDRDNFPVNRGKKTATEKKKMTATTYPPARYNYSTNYYYILPELEPIPLHIHFLTIP